MFAFFAKVIKELGYQFVHIDSFYRCYIFWFCLELEINTELLLLLFYFSAVDEIWGFIRITLSGVHDELYSSCLEKEVKKHKIKTVAWKFLFLDKISFFSP